MGNKPNTSKKTLNGDASPSNGAEVEAAAKTTAASGTPGKKASKVAKVRAAAAAKPKDPAKPGIKTTAAKQGAASKSQKAAAPRAKAATAATSPEAALSMEAVSLRAYFLAENRHRLGLPGDPTQDWIDAERQLRAEAAPKKKASARS